MCKDTGLYALYHLLPDKRYRRGYRKVKLLNGEFDELAKYVDVAMNTALGKRGAFKVERED